MSALKKHFHWVTVAFAVAIAFVMVWATLAYAAPKARSSEECMAYADLALVAATLAKHGMDGMQTKAMLADIYTIQGDHSKEMARLIVESSKHYISLKSGTPRDYARMFAEVCVTQQGNVDGLLGTAS